MTKLAQFLKNVKNYENSQGFITQNTLDRLHAFKNRYPGGGQLSNIRKNVAARIIQNKFRTSRVWSDYLSLNKVPKGANLTNLHVYASTLMNKFSSLSRHERLIRMAKLLPVFIKVYAMDPQDKTFKTILTRIRLLEQHATNNSTRKKLENLRNTTVAIKQRHLAAKKIQTRYKLHKWLPRTNENFIKMVTRNKRPIRNKDLAIISEKKYGTRNIYSAVNALYNKRHSSPSFEKATGVIETAVHKYQTQRLAKIKHLLDDMKRDGRFDYYVSTLINLVKRILKVLDVINREGRPHDIITTAIGPCHIKPKEIPRKYLANMYNQLVYISREYSRKSSSGRKKFLERLDSMLGGRPCLENMLDAMVGALLEPVFEWNGKSIDPPLVQNNDRYPNMILGKAAMTWREKMSNNNRAKLPNNLNKRKQMFWNMVKGLELHIRNKNGIPVYSTTARYNNGGKKFKKSKLANSLEYM